ncbi:sulfatase-like hydrolase/transferase [Rapidithrix thailandica]|uniref:Sulfatase-like hydrolase/transferase n=1 Tax=Rapidithrix thailandica TaxID=413964 RepID=A0AAW9S013_9BACT
MFPSKVFFVVLILFGVYSAKSQDARPNIVWIVCEDISPTLSMYGDSTARTPHLDQLATKSTIYKNAFTTVGVCAPSRSCIITGMYPTSLGTMHMRTARDISSWGKRTYKENIPIVDISGDSIREYSAVIPEYVKCFTEFLRAEGYYCTNKQKTDYQFAPPITAWDQNNDASHWRNRPEGRPFFSVFNIHSTHESRLWVNKDKPLTVSVDSVSIPPYLPDNAITRQDVARHYSNVELMDRFVGDIIEQLKEDGLYDNTVIFFYSDHGGPLPRQKREIYDSGLKVPLLIKNIKGKSSKYTDRLVSFVDFAPTILSLAGIKPPAYMEGKAFMGKYEAAPRKYIFGSSDRFDEHTDRIRIVRNERFLYVRNYYPDLPKYKDVNYRKNISMMQEMLRLEAGNELDATVCQWFGTKPDEELYDCNSDPHNMHDLSNKAKYRTELQKLRMALFQHFQSHSDLGLLPEAQLIDMMWPDQTQPTTLPPQIAIQGNKLTLTAKTQGASMAYLLSDHPDMTLDFNSPWQLYTGPIAIQNSKYIYAIAERIGFKESTITVRKLDQN